MQNEYGIQKIERIFAKATPKVIKALLKVYGVKAKIYRVKNKKILNTIQQDFKSENEWSREAFQDLSLVHDDGILPSTTDTDEFDYTDETDLFKEEWVLITSQTFEQFNGEIAGSLEEERNCFMLDFILQKNDILETTTKNGIVVRYRVKEINALGYDKTFLKRAILSGMIN